MTELHRIRIRHDDDEHWNTRASDVAEEAIRRSARWSGTGIGQSKATWIAASLLFAAGLVLVFSSGKPAALSEAELRIVVAPADDVGRALAVPEQPPSVGVLLIGASSSIAQ